MEVRCGKCNKLFRVSDDKITGTGIKFLCTRCGSYVRITRDDFEQYTLSRSAVSVRDLFESTPGPVAAPLSLETAGPVATETAPPDREPQTFDLSEQATHDEEAREEKAPSLAEPDFLAAAAATMPEPAVEIKPEPLMRPKPAAVPPVESQPEPKPEPLFVPQHKAKPAPERETLPEPPGPAPSMALPPETSIPPAVPKKEHPVPIPAAADAAERSEWEPRLPARPSHSRSLFYVLIAILITLGLAGYGIFVYLQPPPQKMNEMSREMISSEGLQIVNPVGSVEANGDLLITGVIQNASDKERTAWYVVTEIYNAQGAVLSKVRLLNGKQIYSRSEYDILARRGENVQELKAKNLQDKDVVIPPKGMVSFAMRCLQPPAGIASFVAQALPFDPVQLQKEIAEEQK